MAPDGGAFTGEASSGDPVAPVVTLVEGSTFCLSGRSGDIEPDAAQGLFLRDTRIVSTWRLQLNGHRPQVLNAGSTEPYSAVFVSRLPAPGEETKLVVERRRYLGDGMREDLTIRNLSRRPERTTVTLQVAADFADLFAVKEGRVRPASAPPSVSADSTDDGGTVTVTSASGERGVRVTAAGSIATAHGLHVELVLPPRSSWSTTVLVTGLLNGAEVPGTFPAESSVEQGRPAQRLRDWRAASPRVDTDDHELARTLHRSLLDLGALRIFDPQHPEDAAVAAGAPWFMALFGRDSLLASYMAIPLDARLGLGTLRALARGQGTEVDPRTEEQPGRILHETRFGTEFPLVRGGAARYYGSADATPLFVVLLGELARWGLGDAALHALLPAADRALSWVEEYGDADDDGFVEYARMTNHGLVNQGWKDSHDGISFADGRLAEPPIALCEVQGYVYAAWLARADLAVHLGDEDTARECRSRAERLKLAFDEAFWLPDRGHYAVALDRDKRQVDSLASNMGHCLWSGIVPEARAPAVAEQLLSPELFSGWGIRTLASSMGAYNPMSYHNGSVWPHDNALIAAGLMRYGLVQPASDVATAVLDAAAAFDGRLPELFSGFPRSMYDAPLPFPTACSPQAWASAAPLLLVRTLLRLDPDVPRHEVSFLPAWPAGQAPLVLRGLRIADSTATVSVSHEGGELTGLGPDLVVTGTRRAS